VSRKAQESSDMSLASGRRRSAAKVVRVLVSHPLVPTSNIRIRTGLESSFSRPASQPTIYTTARIRNCAAAPDSGCGLGLNDCDQVLGLAAGRMAGIGTIRAAWAAHLASQEVDQPAFLASVHGSAVRSRSSAGRISPHPEFSFANSRRLS